MKWSDRPRVFAISGLAVALLAVWSPAGAGEGNSPAMNDFETLNFRGAAACAPCHSAGGATFGRRWGRDDSPTMVREWAGSIMSHGSIDPFWQAKVRSEVLRAPDIREIIEGKCAACHMPMAATEADFAGDPVLIFDDGFLSPDPS